MKTFLIGLLVFLGLAVPAAAQHRHHGHGRHHHGHHRSHNYVPYALGAVGLAILGGVIYDQYGRRCYREVIGYNSWGDPITRRVCE